MKIEADNRAGMRAIAGTGFTFLQHTLNTLILIIKYTFLLIFLFLLASHESANPSLGNTTIEFYSSEFKNDFLRDDPNLTLIDRCSNPESVLTVRFYRERLYLPAWTYNFEVNASFSELIDLLANAYQYGLLPSEYHYKLLSTLKAQMNESKTDDQKLKFRVLLEKNATWSALHFMNHLAAGIRTADTSREFSNFLDKLPIYLNEQIENMTIREGILSLQPKSHQYVRLQHALAKYMTTALPDTIDYTVSEMASDLEIISKRLIYRGYLDQSFAGDTAALKAAIRNYQLTHCLNVNGNIDKNTLRSLTADTKDEFYKIAVNLDRLRKDQLKNVDFILVNIPEFKLYYYDNHGHSKEFNVIVGKENSPTPILTSQIEWIIANPYWTVPKSITRNEILPLVKKDSMYLVRNRFSIVDNQLNTIDAASIDWKTVNPDDFTYWFKQDNTNNALGVIKFLFPNPHSVYLHDTQAKRLFNKNVRAFSHGCIRLQNPEELAEIIVKSYITSADEISIINLIREKSHKEIKVDTPLPIYIRYYSCSADSMGNVCFYPDIYAKDKKAINDLFAECSWQ